MKPINYILVNILETLLRVLPIPCRTGIIEIGKPDRTSPVFLTCNYHLTVERVKRALRGIDCYLLVANSKGHNVWCGATGGHFTNHNVISVLKTSGIDELVDHKNVILPQLAATGIEAKYIQGKTGWRVVWGPIYAKDIRAFIEHGCKKKVAMRQVLFPVAQRLEMAVMWAFPFSIVASLIMIGFGHAVLVPLNGLLWSLPLLLFMTFPIYSKWLDPKKKGLGFSKYTIIFDFGRMPLILWGVCILCLLGFSIMAHSFTWALILRWGLFSLIVVLLISMDLLGSTPLYKSGLHEDRFLKIVLDEQKCKGTGFCVQVCPKNCYELEANRPVPTMPRAEECVQCGACVVQCPFDALYFAHPNGTAVSPATVRSFKLNLLGKRAMQTQGKYL